jgi:hypothetical protein
LVEDKKEKEELNRDRLGLIRFRTGHFDVSRDVIGTAGLASPSYSLLEKPSLRLDSRLRKKKPPQNVQRNGCA